LGVIYTEHSKQTMDKIITGLVGSDGHAESIAIAFVPEGLEFESLQVLQ